MLRLILLIIIIAIYLFYFIVNVVAAMSTHKTVWESIKICIKARLICFGLGLSLLLLGQIRPFIMLSKLDTFENLIKKYRRNKQ